MISRISNDSGCAEYFRITMFYGWQNLATFAVTSNALCHMVWGLWPKKCRTRCYEMSGPRSAIGVRLRGTAPGCVGVSVGFFPDSLFLGTICTVFSRVLQMGPSAVGIIGGMPRLLCMISRAPRYSAGCLQDSLDSLGVDLGEEYGALLKISTAA